MIDPTLFALGGTIVGAVSLRGITFYLSRDTLGREEIAVARERNAIAFQNVQDRNAVEACSVFEVRMTQQKMVDVGIIKAWEMSFCENENCKNCYKDHPFNRGRRVRKDVQPREHIESKGLSQRIKTVRGERVPVPNEVPDHAYATIRPTNTNYFEVIWTWQDENDGKKYAAKSIHPYKGAFVARPRYTDTKKYFNENKKEITELMKRSTRYGRRSTGDLGPR